MSVEDTVLPRAFGSSGETFTSVEEGVGKMKAALAARSDPSFVIYGRTSSIRAEGIDGVLKRAKAYEDVGVDGLFFVGLRTKAELEALRAQSSLPFIMGSTGPEIADRAYLSSQGARVGGWDHAPASGSSTGGLRSLRRPPGVNRAGQGSGGIRSVRIHREAHGAV